MIATGNHNFERFAALCNTLSGEPRRLRRTGRLLVDPYRGLCHPSWCFLKSRVTGGYEPPLRVRQKPCAYSNQRSTPPQLRVRSAAPPKGAPRAAPPPGRILSAPTTHAGSCPIHRTALSHLRAGRLLVDPYKVQCKNGACTVQRTTRSQLRAANRHECCRLT